VSSGWAGSFSVARKRAGSVISKDSFGRSREQDLEVFEPPSIPHDFTVAYPFGVLFVVSRTDVMRLSRECFMYSRRSAAFGSLASFPPSRSRPPRLRLKNPKSVALAVGLCESGRREQLRATIRDATIP